MKLRSGLLGAALALLVMGAGRPARANTLFMEEYGDIFGARTLTSSSTDDRPKSAISTQKKKDDKNGELVVSPFWAQTNSFGLLQRAYGTGLQWNGGDDHHPYSIEGDFADYNAQFEDFSTDRFAWAGQGKYTVWQPSNKNLPVVSGVVRWAHIGGIQDRADFAVAADERVTREVYVTANLGYGHLEAVGGPPVFNGFVTGYGVTWHPSRWSHLSLSADYVPNNNVDGIDTWSASAAYALSDRAALRFGGGKQNYFFGNLFWKFGK